MIDRICSGMYNLKDILFRYYNSIKHFLDFFSLSNLSMYLYFYISASLSLVHVRLVYICITFHIQIYLDSCCNGTT